MDTDALLAQFWGWFFVIIALAYMVRGKVFLQMLLKMHESKSFVFLSGMLLLVLGLITILLHNTWTVDSKLLITLSGWAAAVKGATRIAFPAATQKYTNVLLKNRIALFRIIMILVGTIGILLIYTSY